MKKLIDNYKRETPLKWRKRGDYIMITCTGLSGLVATSPFTPEDKVWILFALNALGMIGKLLTNFFRKP